jgi:IS30 family transposase
MSTETKQSGQHNESSKASASESAVDRAKSALEALLASSKTTKAPTQFELAKMLKKEIAELRERGFSFEEISKHLKATAQISVSKSALSQAVKKRTRRASTVKAEESTGINAG